VAKTLEDSKFEPIEDKVELSEDLKEMHAVILTIMESCLSEVKHQFKIQVQSLPITSKVFNVEGFLTKEKALLPGFSWTFRKEFDKVDLLGPNSKCKAMLADIFTLKRLLWRLLNDSSSQFFFSLNYFCSQGFDSGTSKNFSVFHYCDDQTNKIITRLQILAKERVYKLSNEKEKNMELEECEMWV